MRNLVALLVLAGLSGIDARADEPAQPPAIPRTYALVAAFTDRFSVVYENAARRARRRQQPHGPVPAKRARGAGRDLQQDRARRPGKGGRAPRPRRPARGAPAAGRHAGGHGRGGSRGIPASARDGGAAVAAPAGRLAPHRRRAARLPRARPGRPAHPGGRLRPRSCSPTARAIPFPAASRSARKASPPGFARRRARRCRRISSWRPTPASRS